MKSLYSRLNPNQKRMLVIGGLIGAVALGAAYTLSGDSERIKRTKREDDVRAVLTARDSRTVGMESLAAKQKNLERRNTELERQLENMQRESKGTSGVFETVTALSKELKDMKRELRSVSKENERLSEQLKKAPKAARTRDTDDGADPVDDEELSEMERTLRDQAAAQAAAQKEAEPKETVETIFGQTPSVSTLSDGEANAGEPRSEKVTIRTIRNEVAEAADEDDESENELYLPIGSIVTGVLINGMDAPTGRQARKDPFPATLRVQKEAILPNHFSADIRECFMQVSGYGDMSSERAYLRGEAISCVREDGGIIETRLDSYAVGEDGKAGVRGRLVSKEGQLLARSLMAGFLEGVAGAFNVQAAPSLRIDGGDSLPIYKQTMDADRVQGGFARGTGNALSRLADYYMDMAESIFPVIEVDAGRQVDIVITRGASLKIKSKGSQ
jgi:conjugal transfer pilus assembly protein TraB